MKLALFILPLLAVVSIAASLVIPNDSPQQELANASPVDVRLYYESLCPYCRSFVLQQLSPVYNKLKNTGIMTLRMYPYGNAHYSVNPQTHEIKFTCQHGEEECRGNTLLACDMHFSNSQSVDFANCMMASSNWHKVGFATKTGQECSKTLNRNWSQLEACLNGTQGKTLLKQVADQTVPHRGVPWITINGVQSDEAQGDLLGTVCGTYKGVKPKECNK